VGYEFTEPAAGRVGERVAGGKNVNLGVRAEIDEADLLLVDGTTWFDDEMVRLGLAGKTAHDMGHLHVGGPGGSLERLGGLRVGRTVYVHINNTNPMLLDDSDERAEVEKAGALVGYDGLELEV